MKKFEAKTDICLARCYWHAPVKFQGADDTHASPHSSASLSLPEKEEDELDRKWRVLDFIDTILIDSAPSWKYK